MSVAIFAACINGFDGTVMGGINSYRQYREYFGFNLTEGTPSDGIVYAIYSIGGIIGAFAAGPASDLKGTSHRTVRLLLAHGGPPREWPPEAQLRAQNYSTSDLSCQKEMAKNGD